MADQKYCRNCGAKNPPEAKFCANCRATFVGTATSPPFTAQSAATPLKQQPPYSPPTQEQTLFGFSRKMVVVGIVVVLLLLSLGCVALMAPITPPASTPTITPTPTPDPFLEKLIAAYKKDEESVPNRQIDRWDVTWNNNTSARLHWTYELLLAKRIVSSDQIITVFPTTQAATNYVNALNLTAYKLSGVPYQSTGGAYRNVSGHAPTVYKDYVWNESSALSKSEYTRHDVIQLDTIVNTINAKSVIAPTATPTPKPTPTPTPAPSGPQLSQAQLDFLQSGMEAKGYSFTQPFRQSGGIGTSYVGSTFYEGQMSKNGIKYDVTIEACKSEATADSQFAFAVTNIQELGFVGSYDSSTQWTGTTIISGEIISATAVESATASPYTVTTIMGSYE